MPTDQPTSRRAPFVSPWQRLVWTLPTAVLICTLAFIWFAHTMEHSVPPSPAPRPVDAQLIELPTPSATRATPPPAATAPAPPVTIAPKQARTQPVATEAPSKSVAPDLTPPLPAPVSSAPNSPPIVAAAPSSAAETRGARATAQPLPVIPDELRQDYLNEAATVRFHIGADGSTVVELLKPTQNPRLNRILLDTLKNWRFQPAMQDGKAVASIEDKTIRVNVR